MKSRKPATVAIAGVLVFAAACSGGAAPDAQNGVANDNGNTITVFFKTFHNPTTKFLENHMASVKVEFEQANPGKHVEYRTVPDSNKGIAAAELAKMASSPATAADVVYEDNFLMSSAVQAGQFRPLDDLVSAWPDWSQFEKSTREEATATDGHVYGIPAVTDTRGIWYDKNVFARAGLPVDWHPKTWDDLLAAARQIKAKLPGVTPVDLTTGKANSEAASMQGLEMLLYGTKDRLYDDQDGKWVVGSQGFKDALDFTNTVYRTGLGVSPAAATVPEAVTRPWTELFPQDKLGFSINGSWGAQAWLPTGPKPWAGWAGSMGWTAMPTQHGEGTGRVSLSGGWSWAVTKGSRNPGLAYQFIKTLQTEKNAAAYANVSQSITVRKDVAADPAYANAQPATRFFTSLVPDAYYRPTQPEYPKVSEAIQDAMQTATTGGAADVGAAARTYDAAVRRIVGADHVVVARPQPPG